MLAQYLTAVNSLLTIIRKKYRHLSISNHQILIYAIVNIGKAKRWIYVLYTYIGIWTHTVKKWNPPNQRYSSNTWRFNFTYVYMYEDVTLQSVVVPRVNLKKVTQGDWKAYNSNKWEQQTIFIHWKKNCNSVFTWY